MTKITEQEKLLFALKYPRETRYLDFIIEEYQHYKSTLIRPRSFLKWVEGSKHREPFIIGKAFWK